MCRKPLPLLPLQIPAGISSRDKTSLGSAVVQVDPRGSELSLLPGGIPFLPPSLPPGVVMLRMENRDLPDTWA